MCLGVGAKDAFLLSWYRVERLEGGDMMVYRSCDLIMLRLQFPAVTDLREAFE